MSGGGGGARGVVVPLAGVGGWRDGVGWDGEVALEDAAGLQLGGAGVAVAGAWRARNALGAQHRPCNKHWPGGL